VRNAVSALGAGSDVLLYVLDNADDPVSRIDPQQLIDGIVAAVKDGTLDAAKFDQSVRRVLDLREKSASLIER
jgi:hypothetical protein